MKIATVNPDAQFWGSEQNQNGLRGRVRTYRGSGNALGIPGDDWRIIIELVRCACVAGRYERSDWSCGQNTSAWGWNLRKEAYLEAAKMIAAKYLP